jgi:release factor glutamine methyltransferase
MKPNGWRVWMTIAEALAAAATRLAAVSDTPRLDAELLLAHALGQTREQMLLSQLIHVPDGFEDLITRRLAHEPVAYILGERDFWTVTLEVGPGVLIPRPDSETLIEAAIGFFGANHPQRILDLGTGPGTLLLAALSAFPEAMGLGVDESERALDFARRNAHRNGLEGRARLQKGDWAEGVEERFDLILCNPPYVEAEAMLDRQVAEFEPASALFAGPDGLDAYRRLIPQLPGILERDGCIILEIGWTQAEPVSAMLANEGLKPSIFSDLGGRNRAILATN